MDKNKLPFKPHRAHPIARRVVTTIVLAVAGALGGVYLLFEILGQGGGVEKIEPGTLLMMLSVTALCGAAVGFVCGVRLDFKKWDRKNAILEMDQQKSLLKLEPIDPGSVEQVQDGYRVGKRAFRSKDDAEAYIYHINIQRELARRSYRSPPTDGT